MCEQVRVDYNQAAVGAAGAPTTLLVLQPDGQPRVEMWTPAINAGAAVAPLSGVWWPMQVGSGVHP